MKLRSVKMQIVVPTILMFTVLMVLLLGVVRFGARRAIENFIYTDIYAKQEDMYQGISMVLDEMSLFYSRIVLSDHFQTIIDDDSLSEESKQDVFRDMLYQVGMNTDLFKEIIFYYDGNTVRYEDEARFGLVPPSFLQTVKESTALIEFHDVVMTADNVPLLLFAKPLSTAFSSVDEGAVFFYIDEATFRSFYDTIDEALGYSFVLTDDNHVVSSTSGEFVGSQLFDAGVFPATNLPQHTEHTIDGETMIIIVNEQGRFSNQYNLRWRMVSVLSHDALYAGVMRLNALNVALGISMGGMALFLSWRVAHKISRPINRIIENLRHFTNTRERAEDKKAYSDELLELESTYDEMINHIIALIERTKQDAENQRKLELYTLQMQINPHFLYNTLDAIAWMAKLKNQADIEHLAIVLAKFFRMSLHKGDKTIKVKEEVEIIRHFLAIELVRFPDKFTVEYHIDPVIEDYQTLKLVLQPIVENAVKHGIGGLERKGHIIIRALDQGEDIVFEVEDDGIGFNPASLKAQGNDDASDGGYGLKNVNDRLELAYGEGYGLSVDSKPNGGTTVRLNIKKT